ncbi:MAG: type II toxin-antitoxin system death-on-curing family toxin [Planctomycetota bacterium]|jgi:death-on-curing protein|nr:type II toxin-antitoxin system death-on-curing family toxin [Planctomycetota bacterium]
MSGITFLALSEVLEIHAEQTSLFGGNNGIRDMKLLESALTMPQAGIDGVYFHPDVFSKAAAYLFHIIQNHPFVDGNKRTGLACAYLFLSLNGIELECDPGELTEMVLAAARGGMNKEEIAGFLKCHAITMSE